MITLLLIRNYKPSVGRHEGKRPLGKLKRRWQTTIIGPKEIECKHVDCIHKLGTGSRSGLCELGTELQLTKLRGESSLRT
jgi:hypothetical protein